MSGDACSTFGARLICDVQFDAVVGAVAARGEIFRRVQKRAGVAITFDGNNLILGEAILAEVHGNGICPALRESHVILAGTVVRMARNFHVDTGVFFGNVDCLVQQFDGIQRQLGTARIEVCAAQVTAREAWRGKGEKDGGQK